MVFYACKKTDSGYRIIAKLDKSQAPRGCIAIEGDDVPYPEIVETNGTLKVINNEENKKDCKVEKIRKKISDAKTIAELKSILLEVL